jgi:hypothetical protein
MSGGLLQPDSGDGPVFFGVPALSFITSVRSESNGEASTELGGPSAPAED